MAIDVKGLSIQNIVGMDIRKLSTSDLKKVANRLVSATNKRIRRLKKSKYKIESYAIKKSLKKLNRGRQFSIKHKPFKGKFKEQKYKGYLEKKINNMIKFNKLESSTITGTKKIYNVIVARLGDTYAKMNKTDKNNFWDLYERMVEERPDLIGSKERSKELQKEVLNQYNKELTEEEKINNIRQFMEEKLQKMEDEENSQDIDMGDFFEIPS